MFLEGLQTGTDKSCFSNFSLVRKNSKYYRYFSFRYATLKLPWNFIIWAYHLEQFSILSYLCSNLSQLLQSCFHMPIQVFSNKNKILFNPFSKNVHFIGHFWNRAHLVPKSEKPSKSSLVKTEWPLKQKFWFAKTEPGFTSLNQALFSFFKPEFILEPRSG